VAPEVVQTQRESYFRGSQPSGFGGEEQPPKIVKRKSDFTGNMQLRGSSTSEGVSGLRGRVNHSKGVPPQVQVGERLLPRLIGRCHGLRRPSRRLRSERILGDACLPRRIHAFQQVLFL
jgi:hypothetical protein